MFSFVALPASPYHFSPCTRTPRCNSASTSQGNIHRSRWHPPVKVTSTSPGRTHKSGLHPPVKVPSTSQGHTHQSRSHPPVKGTPTSQGRTHQSRSSCNVACTVAVHSPVSLPCRAQDKQEPATWIHYEVQDLHSNGSMSWPKVDPKSTRSWPKVDPKSA